MNAADVAGVSPRMDDAFAMLLAVSMAAQHPHEAAALVRLPTIHAYLTERGWKRGWGSERTLLWEAPTIEGAEYFGVMVPKSEHRPDYAKRVVGVSRDIAGREATSLTNVLASWLYSQWQTGTFRESP